jgi:hypothetical protein
MGIWTARADAPAPAVLHAFLRKLQQYEPELVELIGVLAASPPCYISYIAAPPHWLLADGSRPPAQKPFVNSSFDHATRTFRGDIVWEPTDFGGAKWWRCEMVFAADYRSIVGGANTQHAVRYTAPPNGVISTNERIESIGSSAFGEELHYWRQSILPVQMRDADPTGGQGRVI